MKIDERVEGLFSVAVTLAQAGRMKSTIHVVGRKVFIFNMDNTIFLRLKIEKGSPDFSEAASFFANDYEGHEMEVVGGQIRFKSFVGGYDRTKTCPVPKMNAAEAEGLWAQYQPDKSNSVVLERQAVDLLDDELSHVELSRSEGAPQPLFLQRDIYTGSRVDVQKRSGGSGSLIEDSGPSFGPIGIRTTDLKVLVGFFGTAHLYIQKENWIYMEDNTGRLAGVLATCVYDEMGFTKKED